MILANDQVEIFYYYRNGSSLKTFLGIVFFSVLAMILLVFITKKLNIRMDFTNASSTTKLFIASFILGVALLCISGAISGKLSPSGMWWTDKVDGHWGYVPPVDQLCDKDGNKRFSSYDEYREWYIEYKKAKDANR